ncbi:hypothetical protein IPJ72_02540 [Candidatus Peregrinibacteria bacterium]|nr:MAG: hypothetical protein IPJ72_02540 [Candidatus Peregrinibacteria bacterium]
MNILFGFIGVIASLLLVIYRDPLLRFFGTFEWAERRLGPGGSYTVMVLVALGLFLFSLMVMTDTVHWLFSGFLLPFFKADIWQYLA